LKKTVERQTVNHQYVLEQNIRLHETEAYFYNATHPENFNVFEQKRLKRQVKKLAMEAGPSLPVLDLASGTGNVSNHLKTAGLKPIACDLSLEMLNENPSEYRVRCDITRLPFRDGCFGAVTAYSVFHHLPDPTATTEEVGRVAAEQCVLYFDHDHFLPRDSSTLGDYPFTVCDLFGWVVWVILHPKYLRRLFHYALWGRKVHLRNIRRLDQAESHERVKPERLVKVLEGKGFRAQLVSYRRGSYLEAWRKKRNEPSPEADRTSNLSAVR
jgi:SAM-dependent methyltransferase